MLAGLEGAALLIAVGEARALAERRRGAEKQALLAAEQAALVLGERGDVGVAHARLHPREQAGEDLVLHRRRLADRDDLLRALDRLEAVKRLGHVDEGPEIALDAGDEFVRQGAAAGHRYRPAAAALKLARNQLCLILVGISNRGESRGGENFADAAMHLVVAAELAAPAARAHVDHGHEVVGVEDHRLRIAVGGGVVGEPFGIAAEPVVVTLHDQRFDLLLGHRRTHRRPAAVELGVGDRIEQPLVQGALP